MKLSASQLGKMLGLTGEEMNQLLYNLGILSGEPGNYDFTEFGKKYGESQAHHRGTGGYSCYNRYWVTHKYDDSILEFLQNKHEEIKIAKKLVKDRRKNRLDLQKVERVRADMRFLGNGLAQNTTELVNVQKQIDGQKNIRSMSRLGKAGLLLACVSVISYGTYKIIDTAKKRKSEEVSEVDANLTEEMPNTVSKNKGKQLICFSGE